MPHIHKYDDRKNGGRRPGCGNSLEISKCLETALFSGEQFSVEYVSFNYLRHSSHKAG